MTERHLPYFCPGTSTRPGSQPGMGEIPSADESDMFADGRLIAQTPLLVQVLSQVWE